MSKVKHTDEQPVQISFRIVSSQKRRIDRLARAMNRSSSFVCREAIAQYLNLNEWQIADIRERLQELAHGRVVSKEEIEEEWRRKSEG